MTKSYTRNQLFEFVWRADTRDKVNLAVNWLKAHFEVINDADLWDDLMVALSQQNRIICAEEQGREWF